MQPNRDSWFAASRLRANPTYHELQWPFNLVSFTRAAGDCVQPLKAC